MKQAVTITIDTDALSNFTDTYLATLWHITQANPAPYGDREAGDLAEEVGREIIRRFLVNTQPELWAHQGRDHFWQALTNHCRLVNGKWIPLPQPNAAVVIYAEQGSGKTKHIDELLDHYGKTLLIEEWDGTAPLPNDALCLTNTQPQCPYIRLEEALRQAGLNTTGAA